MQKISDKLLINVLLPIVLLTMVFYGFNSAYFPYSTLEKLPDYYYSNVYNFRFISRDALVWFFEQFNAVFTNLNPTLKEYASQYGTPFYHSFFLFNAFFLVLTSWCLNEIFALKTFAKTSEVVKIIIHTFILLLISITSYVLTPYDSPALFLFAITVFFTLKYFEERKPKQLIFISALIFISTLNRETSSLNIAFLGALFLNKEILKKEKLQKFIRIIALPVFAFLLAYISVRIFMKTDEATVSEGIYLVQNLTKPNNILGILFFIIFIRWTQKISSSQQNISKISAFLLLCSPYLLMILMVGILWEIRLFIPIIFGMILLSQMNFEEDTKMD